MIRQYLNVGKYKYCVDFISYDEEIITDKVSAKFVMLRNFQIMNDIVVDDNIYFIEKDLFDKKYRQTLIDHTENNILVFPTHTNGMNYSQSYNIFNDTLIDEDLIKNLLVYNIYQKEKISDDEYRFNEKYIKCNTVKIYHPHIKTDNQLIVHIENSINNIHMHYICNTYNNFKYNSVDEFRYDNNIYSEYIYCHIPDVKDLFDRIPVKNAEGQIAYDYNTYFKEDLNVMGDVSDKNKRFLEDTIILLDDHNKVTTDNVKAQYVPLALLTQPFAVEESVNDNGDKIFKKLYFKYKFNIETNYLTAPINVLLYPYESVDVNNKIYILNTKLTPGTSTFTEDYKFTLSGRCDFGENGIISLVTAFDYPDKEFFDNFYEDTAFGEAYCFYNHIYNKNIYSMNNTGEAMVETYKQELDEIRKLDYISDEQINDLIKDNASLIKKYKESAKSRQEFFLNILKQKRFENFLEEYIDEYGVNIDFFGFKIIMASDKDLKHIIFEYDYSLLKEYQDHILNNAEYDLTNLFDDIFSNLLKSGIFYFNINSIFENWTQLPDNIICQIIFKDRFVGIDLQSNKIVISKEKFKYMTNKSDLYRLDTLTNINNNMKEITLNIEETPELQSILDQITGDNAETVKDKIKQYIKDHSFNFINNINCSIQKLDDVKDNIGNGLSKTQIVYKPIFYKVQTAKTIKLKYQQNQNVGLDLHEYMSKVDQFILSLDNTAYKEIGRNSNYVLFNINALTLSENSGSYQIYNQDNEYITYGSWQIEM